MGIQVQKRVIDLLKSYITCHMCSTNVTRQTPILSVKSMLKIYTNQEAQIYDIPIENSLTKPYITASQTPWKITLGY